MTFSTVLRRSISSSVEISFDEKHFLQVSSRNLSNSDFRDYLLTPRSSSQKDNKNRKPSNNRDFDKTNNADNSKLSPTAISDSSTLSKRKERKKFYKSLQKSHDGTPLHPKLSKLDEDEHEIYLEDQKRLELLNQKYKDRAKERREQTTNSNADFLIAYQGMTPSALTSKTQPSSMHNTLGLKSALGKPNQPTNVSEMFLSNLRENTIEETKFLGGDLETTVLVKGLDYTLLDKIREENDAIKSGKTRGISDDSNSNANVQLGHKQNSSLSQFGINIRNAFLSKSSPLVDVSGTMPEKTIDSSINSKLGNNSGRAYEYDLNREFAEFEIPTTIISYGFKNTNQSLSDIVNYSSLHKRVSKAIENSKNSNISDSGNSRGEGRQSNKNSIRSDAGKPKLGERVMQDYDIYDNLPEEDYEFAAEHQNIPSAVKNSRNDKLLSYFDSDNIVSSHSVPSKAATIPAAAMHSGGSLGKTDSASASTTATQKALAYSKLEKLRQKSDTMGYDECYPDYLEITVSDEKRNKKSQQKKPKSEKYYAKEWDKIKTIMDK